MASLNLLGNFLESSLLRPAALLNHFPNLKPNGTVPVHATTLNDLAMGQSIPDGGNNPLVLEIQGLENRVKNEDLSSVLLHN